MATFTKTHLFITAAAALMLGAGTALAQDKAPAKDDHPKADHPKAAAKGAERVGDAYPLDTCPSTGKKLGSMGDPVVKIYDGRKVRFCCGMCPAGFEKDLAKSLAALDEKIVKDQAPLYPLKTSVVTGKALPEKPVDFVYGNRLVRLGAEGEKADFVKDAKKYMGELDKAVIAAQGKDYPIKTCVVSKEELGADMGKPVDMVVGGRLIRLCCDGCTKDVNKDPAKFIAMVDAAHKGGAGEKTKPESGK